MLKEYLRHDNHVFQRKTQLLSIKSMVQYKNNHATESGFPLPNPQPFLHFDVKKTQHTKDYKTTDSCTEKYLYSL